MRYVMLAKVANKDTQSVVSWCTAPEWAGCEVT